MFTEDQAGRDEAEDRASARRAYQRGVRNGEIPTRGDLGVTGARRDPSPKRVVSMNRADRPQPRTDDGR